MRLLLYSALLASAVFAISGYPTEAEAPQKGGNPNSKPQQSVANELLGVQVAELTSGIQASIQQPPHDPILETANHFELSESIVQDAIPEFDGESRRAAAKSRRHAGAGVPENELRLSDFVNIEESGLLGFNLKAAPEYPVTNHEEMHMSEELSKEEMILMAMEQNNHRFEPNGGSRPALKIPSMGAQPTLYKPESFEEDFSDREEDEDEMPIAEDPENDPTADFQRNSENLATIMQEPEPPAPKPSQPAKAPSAESQPSGSKSKPRPYGMDRPSKHRPTLGNEHFGLPHTPADFQKGENSTDSGTMSYLGFQIPQIKWSSFSEYFPSFWIMGGKESTMKKTLGKSDYSNDDLCQDDPQDELRSASASKTNLCYGIQSTCNDACVNHGFSSGSCLGPYPTPGCMCRMPKSKEFGVVLVPYESKSVNEEDLDPSVGPMCKKCECMQSCKSSGAYTGFCLDRCYCGNPWYTKEVSK